ncbi:MAG TPA: hypothetical protein VGU20_16610 [Stellaceae bacterium]|nr:hypothetical protein [Stellaceae bacterium]
MLDRQRTAEEWLAELSRIMRDYRSTDLRGAAGGRKRAIERLIDLGFSAGEAVHELDRYNMKPAVTRPHDRHGATVH